jgi:RNAse (barnase) inhibitor barstar
LDFVEGCCCLRTTKRGGFEEVSEPTEKSAAVSSYGQRGYNIVIVNALRIIDRHGFFQLFSERLKFPDYFGNNWDAFYDGLTDLSWLKNRNSLIVIENYDLLQARDFSASFLDILSDADAYWRGKGIDFRILLERRKQVEESRS